MAATKARTLDDVRSKIGSNYNFPLSDFTAVRLIFFIRIFFTRGQFFTSRHRTKRIGHLGDELAEGRYDIVTLQEVWMERDYKNICDKVKSVLPYHHYFHSGAIGSGLCIFSKWPIVDTLFCRFSLNSNAHRITERDGFGASGVGLCVIEANGLTINVYTTCTVALFTSPSIHSADAHFTNRLVQCFDLSEFVRFTGNNSDINLVTGDFNTEDHSLEMNVTKVNADLIDAWLERRNPYKDESCSTVDAPDNCYTKVRANNSASGRRVDYVLYSSKPTVRVTCQDCRLTFREIPETNMCYSKHSGVEALFKIERMKARFQVNFKNTEDRLAIFLDVLPYINSSIQDTKWQRVSYLVKCIVIFLLLTSLWLSGVFHLWTGFYTRCGALVVFVALVVLGVIALNTGILVKTTELNQLTGCETAIRLKVRSLESQLGEI